LKDWKQIWNRIKSVDPDISLQDLIRADGFDHAGKVLDVERWERYTSAIAKQIGLRAGNSLYDVGCGSGAFIYRFYSAGHPVGGLDYSESLIEIAKQAMPDGHLYVTMQRQ
jgi:2-polyprenyl-3-methyl-5-hydroxy-6-metoxy-1,4-benzoquinol methylase